MIQIEVNRGRPVYADPKKGEKSDIFLLNANKPQKRTIFDTFDAVYDTLFSSYMLQFNTVEKTSVSPNPRPNEEPIASASTSLADIIEEI